MWKTSWNMKSSRPTLLRWQPPPQKYFCAEDLRCPRSSQHQKAPLPNSGFQSRHKQSHFLLLLSQHNFVFGTRVCFTWVFVGGANLNSLPDRQTQDVLFLTPAQLGFQGVLLETPRLVRDVPEPESRGWQTKMISWITGRHNHIQTWTKKDWLSRGGTSAPVWNRCYKCVDRQKSERGVHGSGMSQTHAA